MLQIERKARLYHRVLSVSTGTPCRPPKTNSIPSMLGGYCLKEVATIAIYLYMWRENKRRDRAAEQLAEAGTQKTINVGALSEAEREAIERGMRDVTDVDNPGFRYVL